MSIQSSLNNATARIKRKLFDNSVSITGRQVSGIRLSIERDIYGNKAINGKVSKRDIDVVVNYPQEVPLSKIGMEKVSSETRAHFFEILPIEIYTRFEDEFKVGDYLYHTLKDELGNIIPIIIEITDAFGIFSTEIVWKKYYASFITGKIDREILEIVDSINKKGD